MMMIPVMLLFMGVIVAVAILGGIALFVITTAAIQNWLPSKRKRKELDFEKPKRGVKSYVVLDDGEIMEVVTKDHTAVHSKY